MPIKKILITGSNGAIGTRLSEVLLWRGYEVVGVDKKIKAWKPEVGRITQTLDLLDAELTAALLPTDVDLIVHLAANARVHDLVRDPIRARYNMIMTFNVLEHARRNHIRRVIFSSSREIYGNHQGSAFHREDDVRLDNCPSPYAASKVADEALISSYQHCYGIDFIIFRFSNIYGMYDDSNRLIPEFQRLAIKGEVIPVFGRDKLLDFTYIDDAVEGIALSVEHFKGARNQTYNLAYGEGRRLLNVASMIKSMLGSVSEICIHENRTGEVMQHVADISKARTVFGYTPKVPFEDGLRRSLAWYAAHPEVL